MVSETLTRIAHPLLAYFTGNGADRPHQFVVLVTELPDNLSDQPEAVTLHLEERYGGSLQGVIVIDPDDGSIQTPGGAETGIESWNGSETLVNRILTT